MAKIIKNRKASERKPNAWIVSSKDRGRKSIKGDKVFLKDGEVFEIELFNPLKNSVLVDIKLNGNSISSNGLVVKPGERVYLDCFIDDRKKFIFKTYNVDLDSIEVIKAIEDNGLLEVYFYKEDIVSIKDWKKKADKVIIEKWYPYYPSYPNYPSYPTWTNTPYYTLNNQFNTTSTNNLNNKFNTTSTNMSSFYSSRSSTDSLNNFNFTNNVNLENSVETGRVEKGKKSSQKFETIDMNFESVYISSTIIKILPDSRKPIESKDIKKKKKESQSDIIISLIKKLSELHDSGIITDNEFNDKKNELLSRI